MSLTARLLEANGICTVVIGSAMDIAQYCGTPRFVFNDFPLGNPLGIPFDKTMQQQSVDMALDLVASATQPGAVLNTGFRWSEDESWKQNYARVDDSNREALRLAGQENRAKRKLNKEKGLQRNS